MIKKATSGSIKVHKKESGLLSEYACLPEEFPAIETIMESFREPNFLNLTVRKRFKQINHTLYQLIRDTSPPAFLLSAVLNFFDRINREKILIEPLNFAAFEFWLNNFSGLSDQENYEIRAKIVGKWIPRGDYQVFFPIGRDRVYAGTHFITAHLSPDIDTMIASFWGWVDSFGARVGTGLHLWCLPGGPPDSSFTTIFRNMFGEGLFLYLPRVAQTLTLTAMDLVTQKLFTKELGHTQISSIDHGHGSNEKAVILINEQGHYLGDWHSSDVELVRQIIILFKACLHWFENNLHTKLISLFSQPNVSIKDLPAFNSSIFDVKIQDCQPALEFNEKQKSNLHDFFHKVLGVEKGIEGTFRDLNLALSQRSIVEMMRFQEEFEALFLSDIFDEHGRLKEDRPRIFHCLQEIFNTLDQAIFNLRNYVERLDIVLSIKHAVLGSSSNYITLRSDMNEMRHKMQHEDFLTVVIHEQEDALFPVGIVRARDLRESGLGTVSFRDFCNLEEVKMASYLEIISVIDHHKSSLKTSSVPTAIIGDAQSCNVLIAEQAFILNDKHSLGGMSPEEIEAQVQEVSSHLTTPSQMRILQRLLQKRIIAQKKNPFYIHPKREFIEYLCFLHAILDDTDLLTKTSYRDLECVAQLLNRLKSLSLKREVEIIHFDDISHDKHFIQLASQRILQQADMYSLYKKIYTLRESEVESHLALCINGHYSNIFLDAKEQNKCARVGQTKMFNSNFSYFLKHAHEIRQVWLNKSLEVYQDHPEIDLHIHMISTIASAEEVYKNQMGPYSHQDELWFWIPPTQQGYHHLNSFLAGFQYETKEIKKSLSLEFLGPKIHEYLQIFNNYFPNVPKKTTLYSQQDKSVVILRFKAGALNSRKSMITPYLPRLIS